MVHCLLLRSKQEHISRGWTIDPVQSWNKSLSTKNNPQDWPATPLCCGVLHFPPSQQTIPSGIYTLVHFVWTPSIFRGKCDKWPMFLVWICRFCLWILRNSSRSNMTHGPAVNFFLRHFCNLHNSLINNFELYWKYCSLPDCFLSSITVVYNSCSSMQECH